MTIQARPVFLELQQISMPPGAIVSIGHRISGVLLFALLPLVLFLLQRSLQSPEDFAHVVALLESWPMRLPLLPFIWALLHHLLAGVRLLFLDMGVGVARDRATRSAHGVLFLSLALLIVVVLFG